MRCAVATCARLRAQCTVQALGYLGRGFYVAGGAFDPGHRLRVWVFLDAGVTGGAAEAAVHAGGMLGRVHVNAAARFGLHSLLAMAGQALFVLVRARAGPCGGTLQRPRQREQKAEERPHQCFSAS